MPTLGSNVKMEFKPMNPTMIKPPNGKLVNNKLKGKLKPKFSSKLQENSPYNER